MLLVSRSPLEEEREVSKPRLSCLAEIASQHLSSTPPPASPNSGDETDRDEDDSRSEKKAKTVESDDSVPSQPVDVVEKPYRTRKAALRRGPPMSESKEFDPLRGRGYRKLPFPIRLFDMIDLESKNVDPVLKWTPDGRGFLIRDQDSLVRDILPKYDFKASKFASIQRNLNIYGFQRVVKGPNAGAYIHPLFHRDMDAGTLAKFVRKGVCGRSLPVKQNFKSSSSVDYPEDSFVTSTLKQAWSPLSTTDSDGGSEDTGDSSRSSSQGLRSTRKRETTAQALRQQAAASGLDDTSDLTSEEQMHLLASFGTGAFPFRLFKLLCTECMKNPHIVTWGQNGRCFHLVDEMMFVKHLLPRHGFKASKLASFQRNLNIYSFQRIVKGPDAGAYFHPLFRRDMKIADLCKIVRKTQSVGRNARALAEEEAENAASNAAIKGLSQSDHGLQDPEYTVRDSLFAIRQPQAGGGLKVPTLDDTAGKVWANPLSPLLLAAQFAARAPSSEPATASTQPSTSSTSGDVDFSSPPILNRKRKGSPTPESAPAKKQPTMV